MSLLNLNFVVKEEKKKMEGAVESWYVSGLNFESSGPGSCTGQGYPGGVGLLQVPSFLKKPEGLS